jgi:hypothetical protein
MHARSRAGFPDGLSSPQKLLLNMRNLRRLNLFLRYSVQPCFKQARYIPSLKHSTHRKLWLSKGSAIAAACILVWSGIMGLRYTACRRSNALASGPTAIRSSNNNSSSFLFISCSIIV